MSDDPFLARLNRLDATETPAPRAVDHTEYPRDAQNSVLLPLIAMALLLVGGASFALMITLPDPNGMSIAATTLDLLSSK